jgi:phospholipase/lecithinase/hemolysin
MLSGAAPGSARALKPYVAWPLVGPTSAANFAFGGTGTSLLDRTPGGLYAPGLKGQVELFRLAMRGKKPSPRALFAIVTGANDYSLDRENGPLAPTVVVRNIGESVARLYASGARTIMVLGLPDLGLLPGADPAASQLTLVHNTLLQATLAQLSAQLPGARLIFVDINDVFALLPPGINVDVPALAAYGAQLPEPQPALAGCLFVNPATCQDAPFAFGTPFLFWDIVHPTTGAHKAIGDYLFFRLSQ